MNAPGALRHSRGHRAAQVKQAEIRDEKMRRITSRLLGGQAGQQLYAKVDPFALKDWAKQMREKLASDTLYQRIADLPQEPPEKPFYFREPLKPMGLYDPKLQPIAKISST